MVNVFFINNAGGGFADSLEVKKGTKISAFFKENMKKVDAKNCLIRVNRDIVSPDYVLQEGDRITITPMNIQGAN